VGLVQLVGGLIVVRTVTGNVRKSEHCGDDSYQDTRTILIGHFDDSLPASRTMDFPDRTLPARTNAAALMFIER
jgi:hypothetical protein